MNIFQISSVKKLMLLQTLKLKVFRIFADANNMRKSGQSLDKIIESTDSLQQLFKKDLQFGDLVLVSTCNSTYRIRVLEGGFYRVTGGWFDQNDLPVKNLKINGCTWGGSIIKMDIVAACGLCLEFANGVVTTPIQKFCIVPFTVLN